MNNTLTVFDSLGGTVLEDMEPGTDYDCLIINSFRVHSVFATLMCYIRRYINVLHD